MTLAKFVLMFFRSLVEVFWYFIFVGLPVAIMSPLSWFVTLTVVLFTLLFVTSIHFLCCLIRLIIVSRKNKIFYNRLKSSNLKQFIEILEQI